MQTLSEELALMETFVAVHVSDHSGFHYRQLRLNLILLYNLPFLPRGECVTTEAGIGRDRHGGEDSRGKEGEIGENGKVCGNEEGLLRRLLGEELELTTDLIATYPGHEAIWYHR